MTRRDPDDPDPDALDPAFEATRFRPLVLRERLPANDDDPATPVVVPHFGKVGVVARGPTPVFVKSKFELKPYAVNLDKLLQMGNNSGGVDPVVPADPGRDGTPPGQASR